MDANTASVLNTLILAGGVVGGIWAFFWGISKLADAANSPVEWPELPTYTHEVTTWCSEAEDDDSEAQP